MPIRIILGLGATAIAFAIAGRRFFYLFRLVGKGQSDPKRFTQFRARAWAELSEVGGQRKLLRWTVPGMAHAFTFWGFTILLFTILEAYGDLFDKHFVVPLIGRGRALGFIEDFFAVAVLVSLCVFTAIRYKNSPKRKGRLSRFFGSHTGAAWLVLVMIASVMLTLIGYRAAQVNTGDFPYGNSWWPFASHAVSRLFVHFGAGVNADLETVLLVLNIAVIIGFAVFLSYSKHLHIALAPINVATSRRPRALGPLYNTPDMDMENVSEDTVFGAGHIEDLSLEAAARHPDLHRVRAVPVGLPGLEHRQAAVPEAAHHGAARQPLRVLPRASSGLLRPPRTDLPSTRRSGPPPRRPKPPPSSPAPSTPTCCGRVSPAGRAWRSARSTSSTSTPSSRCAATRSSWSRVSPPRRDSCCATSRTRATPGVSGEPSAPNGPRPSTSRCP